MSERSNSRVASARANATHNIRELRAIVSETEISLNNFVDMFNDKLVRCAHLASKVEIERECFIRLYKILSLRHDEINELNARLDASERDNDNKNALIKMLLESNTLFYSESVLDMLDAQELRDVLEYTLNFLDELHDKSISES